MTIIDLIDYLGQFAPDTRVVLTKNDAPKDSSEYVVLDVLDFGPEECATL